MVAVFDYDFQVKRDRFDAEKCELYSLSNYENIVLKGLELDYVREDEIEVLRRWRQSPRNLEAIVMQAVTVDGASAF